MQIYGPANNQIEVHYKSPNHSSAQGVETVILETLARFMSESAINTGLNWVDTTVVEPQHTHENNVPYTGKRKLPSFSYTKYSHETYHSATVAGRRKVDSQHVSSVTQVHQDVTVQNSTNATYASAANVTIASENTSINTSPSPDTSSLTYHR